jgi:enoyl-CoA hydratase/carnithine racemase
VLDRPARCNALDMSMWTQLAERLEEAAELRPRALIITGRGEHFCAGMDLKPDNPVARRATAAIFDGDAEIARGLILELKGCLAGLRRFDVPVIAAIEGVCVGGGFELALHCDIRVASRRARVGLPEVRVGMIPDVGGTTLLTRLLGPGRAAMVICSGREYGADEALAMGMVDQVVEPSQALSAAQALAADIARGGPQAISLALDAIRSIGCMGLDEGMRIETDAGVAALVSGEAQEGLMAFAQKRPPAWPGL